MLFYKNGREGENAFSSFHHFRANTNYLAGLEARRAYLLIHIASLLSLQPEPRPLAEYKEHRRKIRERDECGIGIGSHHQAQMRDHVGPCRGEDGGKEATDVDEIEHHHDR